MSRARRAVPQRKNRSRWLLGAGVVAVVAIAGVAVAWQVRSEDGQGAGQAPAASVPVASADASAGTGGQAPTTPPASRDNAASADACVKEIAATEAVVGAARVAAGHWREHVQARTDLMAGKNTEATTKAIWKRTRLAGPADVAKLTAATSQEQRVEGGCKDYDGAAASACRQRLAALDAAAASGRAAAGDWADHLAMMQAHAAGDFGAEHAQHLWVSAWEAAPKNLNAFAQASTTLAKAPACRPA